MTNRWIRIFVCLALALASGCPSGDGGEASVDATADGAALLPDAGGTDALVLPDAGADCVDPDGDGYGDGPDCLGADCASADPERHPGAVEVCDGLDNDCNGSTDELEQCGKPRLWVFLLAGQSNMVGLGINSELSGADSGQVADTYIYYNGSIHPNTNALQWLPLAPGFGVSESRFGPELGFGQGLRDHWAGRPVAFIKVAEGGTALADRWLAPSGDLYQLLLSEAQDQLAALAESWQPEVVGFVWMQGESDACDQTLANAYFGSFLGFVGAVRQELGVEYLPLTAGLIAEQSMWPYAATVRNATNVVARQLGQVDTVETSDLPRHATDPAHYDTQGSLTLGRRFAESMVAMLPSEHVFGAGVGEAQGDGFWLYRERYAGGVAAMSYDAANDRWLGSEASLLIGAGWMHPGSTHDAELAWWAPYAALIQIDVAVASGDDGGGDGTWVSVARDGVVLWGPVAVPNGGSDQLSLQLVVQQGQELQFRTSAGPAHNADDDTTTWQIALQVLDVDP